MSLVTLQKEHDRKLGLVQNILEEFRLEIIERRMLNVTFDLIVSNYKLSTLSVTTKSIMRTKQVPFSEMMKKRLLEELESCLWVVLTEDKEWFTLTVPIVDGTMRLDKVQFKFTKKPLEG